MKKSFFFLLTLMLFLCAAASAAENNLYPIEENGRFGFIDRSHSLSALDPPAAVALHFLSKYKF